MKTEILFYLTSDSDGWTQLKDPDHNPDLGLPISTYLAKVDKGRILGLALNHKERTYRSAGKLPATTQATLNVFNYTPEDGDALERLGLKVLPRICGTCGTSGEVETEDGSLICLICGTEINENQ
jgi:hypothetical protein